MLSALNGVLGDYLVNQNNPLAIPMQLRENGESLDLAALEEKVRHSSGKLVIFIHGLCMNDIHWQSDPHSFSDSLSDELNIPSIFLHYNTGLHISDNGRNLSALLEQLVEATPSLMELNIISHSMGGLVARSACHYAIRDQNCWLSKLSKVVFLGTPHHGTPMEKVGNWIELSLEMNAYSKPFARLGKIRSSGITDLRHGYVVENDWYTRNRFDYASDPRLPAPLPSGVTCIAIAAILNDKNRLYSAFGDGLVTLQSAFGQHPNASLDLQIPESQRHIVKGIHHTDLITHPEVYALIKQHLA